MRQRLAELHERHGRTVTVIGQSLGGIYARLLARESPDAVRQVITLGSPYRMVEGDRSSATGLWQQVQHLHNGDLSLMHLREQDRPPLQVPASSFYSRTDGVAPWQTCIDVVREHTENIEVRGSHVGMAVNPAIVAGHPRSAVAARGRLAAVLGPAVGSGLVPASGQLARTPQHVARRLTVPANDPRHICQTALGARDQGVAHAAAQWTGCVVHLQRAAARADAHHIDQHLRPLHRTRWIRDVQGHPGPPRGQVAPGEGLPSESGAGSRRPRSPVLGGGRGVRPRVPRAPHRTAQAGRLAPVLHPGCPVARPPARPLEAAVGAVRHRRPRQGRRRSEGWLRLRAEDPSRRCRRQVGHRDDHRHPLADAGRVRSTATGQAMASRARPVTVRALQPGRDERCANPGPGHAPDRQDRAGSGSCCGDDAQPIRCSRRRYGTRYTLQRAGHAASCPRREVLPLRRAQADAQPRGGGDGQRCRPGRDRRARSACTSRRPANCQPRRCAR